MGEQIRLVPQRAAEPCVPLTPPLEAPRDCVEEPGFARGPFANGRLAEETRTQLRVPAYVVPLAHLILEEPRHEEALRTCYFHRLAVAQPGRVGHEMIEDLAEIRGSSPIDARMCRHLSVVCEHAGVIQQLLLIDGGLRNVLKARDEKLQRPAMIGRQQFLHWTHDTHADLAVTRGDKNGRDPSAPAPILLTKGGV